MKVRSFRVSFTRIWSKIKHICYRYWYLDSTVAIDKGLRDQNDTFSDRRPSRKCHMEANLKGQRCGNFRAPWSSKHGGSHVGHVEPTRRGSTHLDRVPWRSPMLLDWPPRTCKFNDSALINWIFDHFRPNFSVCLYKHILIFEEQLGCSIWIFKFATDQAQMNSAVSESFVMWIHCLNSIQDRMNQTHILIQDKKTRIVDYFSLKIQEYKEESIISL